MPEDDLQRVPPVGPVPAKIALIGEAPGETEVKKREPFVGMAGNVLTKVLEEVGIPRGMCYITNVMKTRPTANKFRYFYHKENGKGKIVPTPELEAGRRELALELACVQPNVIVCLGNEALRAVTGLDGIMNWRGSVLRSKHGKVVPTIHPASVLRNWPFLPMLQFDLQRAAEEMKSPDIHRTERELVVAYNTDEALKEIERLRRSKRVAFDIETESGSITSIAFSDDAHRAVAIPFWFGDSGILRTQEDEQKVWSAVKGLLEDPEVQKVAHNASYDIGELKRMKGIWVRGLALDTMVAMHACYIELPKGLDFACSIYTDQPYYKFLIKTDDMDTYFRYNATDACVTYEVGERLEEDMEEFGVKEFYWQYMHSLIEPLIAMELKGVRFDTETRNKLRVQYRNQIKMLEERLTKEAGRELNVSSHPQMIKWLYTDLKLPKQVKKDKETGKTSLTSNEEALEKLYKLKRLPALKTILEIRAKKKVYSTYLSIPLDEDKRIRCSYNLTGTETGRLSSSSTLRGTGTNLQNIPDGQIRKLFLPDEGMVFINADLSQAEARVVACLAEDQRLINVFEEGGDIHRKNAANIFGKKEEEVTNDERQLAKRVVHASNYGMGPRTFASQAGISESRARGLLNQYFATYPRIKVWHMRIQDDLKRTRTLITPFGRKRVFFNKWSESLLKEALAFIPQSTVADLLNQGLVELYHRSLEDNFDLLLQVHDSVLVQCPKKDKKRVAGIMEECLHRPVGINGQVMKIPVDFKYGTNWGDMK